MLTYLVCYDIEQTRERTLLARELLQHGDRVQKSVFEIQLCDQRARSQLLGKIRDIVGDDADVRFYRITATALADSGTLNGEPVASPPAVLIF